MPLLENSSKIWYIADSLCPWIAQASFGKNVVSQGSAWNNIDLVQMKFEHLLNVPDIFEANCFCVFLIFSFYRVKYFVLTCFFNHFKLPWRVETLINNVFFQFNNDTNYLSINDQFSQ
jgi:hypothetical protein